jgi:L-fucose mutarotase
VADKTGPLSHDDRAQGKSDWGPVAHDTCLRLPAQVEGGHTMLKGLDPRLNADVLFVLRSMGHGDMLILADTNFPAESIARQTVYGSLVRMDNLTSAEATEAILSVMPLDTFVDDFAGRMEVIGAPDEIPEAQAEVQAMIDAAADKPRPMIGIERFAFYELAKQAFCIIQTGDRRFYADFMLRMGVIPPDG